MPLTAPPEVQYNTGSGGVFNVLSFGVGGGSLTKAGGSVMSNLTKNFTGTLFENTTRKVAGQIVSKSTYGMMKNITKNIGQQFAETGVIWFGQFFTSKAVEGWGF